MFAEMPRDNRLAVEFARQAAAFGFAGAFPAVWTVAARKTI
jgi:hypothetical protein